MIELPVFTETSSKFEYTIELETKIFTFQFSYNTRSENWYMNILNQATGEEINSKKVIVNYPMLDQNSALFSSLSGDIFCIKSENVGEALSYTNFGTVYKMFYYTADEVAAWKETNGIRT